MKEGNTDLGAVIQHYLEQTSENGPHEVQIEQIVPANEGARAPVSCLVHNNIQAPPYHAESRVAGRLGPPIDTECATCKSVSEAATMNAGPRSSADELEKALKVHSGLRSLDN